MRVRKRVGRSLFVRVAVPFVLVSVAAFVLLVAEASSALREQRIAGAVDRARTNVKAIELSGEIDPTGGVVEAVTSFAAPRDVARILVISGTPAEVIASSRFDDVGLEIAQVPGDDLRLVSLAAGFEHREKGATLYVATHGDQVEVVIPAQILIDGSILDTDEGTVVVVALRIGSETGILSLLGGAMREELLIVGGLLFLVTLVFWHQILKPISKLSSVLESDTLAVHAGYFAARADEFGVLCETVLRTQLERDVADAETYASRARLASIVNNAPDAIITVDAASRVQEFNAAAERLFGIRFIDVHRTPARYLFDDDRDSNDSIGALIESPGDYKRGVELVSLSAAGSRFPVWATASESIVDGAAITTLIVRDLSEVRDAEARLAHIARHDSLTGLPNRRLAIEWTEAAFRRPRHSNEILAMACIDLDRFKLVNDSFGHAAGDALLIETADRLLKAAAGSAFVARLGGDEFLVVIEAADVTAIVDVADRIRVEISNGFDLGGGEAFVDASIGVAVWDGESFDAMGLLKDADTAMYRAKDAGRDCYRIFDPAMQEAISARQSLETALKHAVERGEFVLRYQPIIDLMTGRVIKSEALIRWNRPGHGSVPPAEFISVAEEMGLINLIGEWVVDEVCRQSTLWHAEGLDIGIALNVSSRQLGDAEIVAKVAGAIARHGCNPTDLTIEITESMLIANPTRARAILEALKSLGVAISLDDFGTGFSSLVYLRNFPIDILKIDQSFIESVGSNVDDTAIVAAVVTLARSLRLVTVAEGVQNHENVEALLSLGCDYAQGYFYSEPIDADSFKEFALQRAN